MRNITELNPWLFRELLHDGEYAVRVESEEDIQKLARRLGYDRAEYYCDYNDHRVYELLYEEPRMYATSPEMLFVQYKYARLDRKGEIRELQKAIYDMEFPEASPVPEKSPASSDRAPAGEIISLRSKVTEKLNDLKDKLNMRRDEPDDYWIDDGYDRTDIQHDP